ncbi:hypothetical protein BGZ49_002905 [Haplosporangium sp. Z 27]|nr:hypothetical protein BGZ49_002905 [Haplosporangium sp. Z 27]
MFGVVFSSLRGQLEPKKGLELAKLHLQNAKITEDRKLKLELCTDAENALSRIKRAARKSLTSSKDVDDRELCNEIANVYTELGELLEDLRKCNKDCLGKAGKWKQQDTSEKSAIKEGQLLLDGMQDPSGIFPPAILAPDPPSADVLPVHSNTCRPAVMEPDLPGANIAQVPSNTHHGNMENFVDDHYLPGPDDEVANTPQLAYCLYLLSIDKTSAEYSTETNATQRQWITKVKDSERKRLVALSEKILGEFMNDELMGPATVAEVICLAPVLNEDHYRKLLGVFIDGISHSTLLDYSLLEGLAQQIQYAHPKLLKEEDLVSILDSLSKRLQHTHHQSGTHLYRLTVAVSHVLDAMIKCEVEGLKREELHKPLSDFLMGLKSSSDPYLVYQATYACQALQNIRDDESSWKAFIRRTRLVVGGVSGVASAVKSLNFTQLLDSVTKIYEGSKEAYDGIKEMYETLTVIYQGVESSLESGQGLIDSFKICLVSGERYRWYPTLRIADDLIHNGQLEDLKKLVCLAPSRRVPAFGWGLCQILGEIAINPAMKSSIRKNVIELLTDVYTKDEEWHQKTYIKRRSLIILIQISNSPDLESNIKEYARNQLRKLANSDDVKIQAIYNGCINEPLSRYPLKVSLPPLTSSTLLERAQSVPSIDDNLRILKRQRQPVKGNQPKVYER